MLFLRRQPISQIESFVFRFCQSSLNLQMIGLQDNLLQHELARHSIEFAVRFDFITHTFESAFTLQYFVIGLLDVVDE